MRNEGAIFWSTETGTQKVCGGTGPAGCEDEALLCIIMWIRFMLGGGGGRERNIKWVIGASHLGAAFATCCLQRRFGPTCGSAWQSKT